MRRSDHLLEAAWAGSNEVIGKGIDDGLVAVDEVRCASQRRRVAVWTLLADVDKVCHLRELLDGIDQWLLLWPTSPEISQQILVWHVEVIFNRALIGTPHNDDIANPRLDELLHHILNDRLIN